MTSAQFRNDSDAAPRRVSVVNPSGRFPKTDPNKNLRAKARVTAASACQRLRNIAENRNTMIIIILVFKGPQNIPEIPDRAGFHRSLPSFSYAIRGSEPSRRRATQTRALAKCVKSFPKFKPRSRRHCKKHENIAEITETRSRPSAPPKS